MGKKKVKSKGYAKKCQNAKIQNATNQERAPRIHPSQAACAVYHDETVS